jgi:hypothetical protein
MPSDFRISGPSGVHQEAVRLFATSPWWRDAGASPDTGFHNDEHQPSLRWTVPCTVLPELPTSGADTSAGRMIFRNGSSKKRNPQPTPIPGTFRLLIYGH